MHLLRADGALVSVLVGASSTGVSGRDVVVRLVEQLQPLIGRELSAPTDGDEDGFIQWWRDVFGERPPPVGSRRWRQQMASLPVPPATRGPCLLLSDDSTLLLEDEGAMRLSGS